MNRFPWFRMYTESRNDSKLATLTDGEFRVWHKLLCYSAENEPRGVIDFGSNSFRRNRWPLLPDGNFGSS